MKVFLIGLLIGAATLTIEWIGGLELVRGPELRNAVWFSFFIAFLAGIAAQASVGLDQ